MSSPLYSCPLTTLDAHLSRQWMSARFFFSFRSDSTPTLCDLISFPMADGKVNLAMKIGADYTTFGILLLDDATGDHITAIENEYKCNADRINLRVLQLWVQGKGRQPVTWATLVAVLQDTGLVKLANDIEAIKIS